MFVHLSPYIYYKRIRTFKFKLNLNFKLKTFKFTNCFSFYLDLFNLQMAIRNNLTYISFMVLAVKVCITLT